MWLIDAHRAPHRVEAPAVGLIHEIGWSDPFLRGWLDQPFLTAISAGTDAGIARCVRVITPSESARGEVIASYDYQASRVHTVPYGVDLEVFRPDLEGGQDLVGATLGRTAVPYVLYVGSVHPRKNLPALRAAIGGIAIAGLPHVLVLVTSGIGDPDSVSFERAATAELHGAPGRIVRLSPLDDSGLARLMAGAAAVCLPSFSEGFGLPALEAMACGTPVIVSNRGGLPEVVGDAGIIVEPTPDAIEGALVDVLTQPRRATELGERAYIRAHEFPWSRTIDGILRVLELVTDETAS